MIFEKFKRDLLNDPVIIGVLQQRVPIIGRLNALEDLSEKRITDFGTIRGIVEISFEGTASQDLYPYVASRLIERDVIKRYNIISQEINHKGKSDENYFLHLKSEGAQVQVSLTVHNPLFGVDPQGNLFHN